MSIQVIGAGWGRTGTESLKKALEMLGYSKCYHMFELIRNGKNIKYWEQLERGEKPDYEDLFKGYKAAVDGPACVYYNELMQQYPDAKVILTVRDADKWFDSASKTVLKKPPQFLFSMMSFLGIFIKNLSYFPKIFAWAEKVFYGRLLGNRLTDREYVKEQYNKWNEEVKRTVPAEKLLVYEVKDGWEPLCKFLGVLVPAEDFPRSNDSDEFQERLKLKNLVRWAK